MPTNYWLKFGNTAIGFNGSGVQYTHVEQPGQLVISLNGIGTGFDTTKNFNVLVTFGSAISYTVNGIPVPTPSATCILTLHAGQVSIVGNIPFGTTFVISETVTDEGYELQSITVPSGTMTDGGIIHSVVNNVYHAPGTLTLTKVVSGTGFDSSKQFEIVTTFGRAISYTVDGTPVATPSATYTAYLAHNQSVVIGNIPSGVTYSVAETPLSQQDIDLGYSNGSVVGDSGTMTDAGSLSATANNSYSMPFSPTVWFTTSNMSQYCSANFYESDGATPWSTNYSVSGTIYTGTGVSNISNGGRLRIANAALGSHIVKVSSNASTTYVYEETGGGSMVLLGSSSISVSLKLIGVTWYYGSRQIPDTSRIRVRTTPA